MSRFQREFIRYLQDRAAIPGPQKHWSLYRDAYLNRPALALSESVLERVAILFGSDFLQSLLMDYLQELAPQHPIMVECLRSFHSWLAGKGWDRSHPELCDLVRLSLMRWDVLICPDPLPLILSGEIKEADLRHMVLQRNHALFISQGPVYDLWMAGDPERNTSEELWVGDKPQAILFYKSSATALETLLVPAGLESFTQTLSVGARLDEAIAGFLESSADDSSIAILPGFIAHLQSTSAWENFL
jgi:hypothetical protein